MVVHTAGGPRFTPPGTETGPSTSLRVGVIQSSYIPWRGYFDIIASVDVFVIYDDVAFSKGSWRNRNKVKTPRGIKWITVPTSVSLGQTIDEVAISYGAADWAAQHRALLKESLGDAPFYEDARDLWERGVSGKPNTISQLNIQLTTEICSYLGIRTPRLNSRDLGIPGTSTEKLVGVLEKLGATTYLSGPTAKDYLNEQTFRSKGIRLEYKEYDYRPYPQLHGTFEGAVSVLDLIANCGPRAAEHIRSHTPDLIAVG